MTGAIDMEQQKLREQIEDFIKGLGGSFAGFSNLGDILPDSLKEYPYAITFGIRLSDAIIDEIEDKPTYTYFNHYRSVNALIDQIGLRTLFIQDMGYKAYYSLLRAYLMHLCHTVPYFLTRQVLYCQVWAG